MRFVGNTVLLRNRELTERGNINREIIKNNMLLEQAKEMLMLAKQELHSAQYATYKSTQIKNAAVSVKNEVMEMITKVRERKGRLDLPIVSGIIDSIIIFYGEYVWTFV